MLGARTHPARTRPLSPTSQPIPERVCDDHVLWAKAQRKLMTARRRAFPVIAVDDEMEDEDDGEREDVDGYVAHWALKDD